MGAARSRLRRKRGKRSTYEDDHAIFTDAVVLARNEHQERETLSKITHFDPLTIDILDARFQEISASQVDDKLIDPQEFAEALGLPESCFLVKRIFQKFNITRTDAMTFREFVTSLSQLSPAASLDEKIGFSFQIYDINGDGSIEFSEIKELLVSILQDPLSQHGVRLTESDIDQICRNTLKEMDIDGNGSIELKEYSEMVHKNPSLVDPFTINIEPLVQAARRKASVLRKLTLSIDHSDEEEKGPKSTDRRSTQPRKSLLKNKSTTPKAPGSKQRRFLRYGRRSNSSDALTKKDARAVKVIENLDNLFP